MVGGTRSPRDWLLIRPRREEPVIKAHNKHVQHGCYDVHQRRGSGAYAAKTPSSDRRVADASRAVPGRRDFGLEDVNGKSRGRSSGVPWGFERCARGAGSGRPTAREASSRAPSRPASFRTSSGNSSSPLRSLDAARDARAALFSATRVIRHLASYRDAQTDRRHHPLLLPQAKLSSKMSSGIKAQRTTVAKVRSRTCPPRAPSRARSRARRVDPRA